MFKIALPVSKTQRNKFIEEKRYFCSRVLAFIAGTELLITLKIPVQAPGKSSSGLLPVNKRQISSGALRAVGQVTANPEGRHCFRVSRDCEQGSTYIKEKTN